MPNKNLIRVSEFEKLYYDDSKPFKQKHWNALCRYLESVNKTEKKRKEYYRILNKGIQFTNFVGVIQAADLTIEVLPKTDRANTTADNESFEKLEGTESKEKQQWHDVLLRMLNECRLLKVNHVDYANLNLRSNSILEIYLDLFLEETAQLQREGLLKKYRKTEANQTALKGQLIFPKNIAYNSTHQERFYVRYTEYNRNNIYNQLLYKTLCLIPKISNSAYLSDKVGRLKLDFPEVSNCNATEETFNKLQFDRKTERYKEALLISKMLLLNYRPDITGGAENVIAILFDMNKLWEEFVYRRLKREEGNNGLLSVRKRQRKPFWSHEQSSYSKVIIPDIVVEHIDNNDEKRTTIIDTKWKILDDCLPADDDLKQMFVYNLYWECDKSVLLYPGGREDRNSGQYHDFGEEKLKYKNCSVALISVLYENKLDVNLGKRIANLITI